MGKFGTLTSCKILNPWIDCHKICHSWLRPRGERFSEARAEIKPKIIESSIIFDQTLWPILTHDGSKCAESRKYVPFGVTIFNFNIWPLFTPQNVKFYPKIAISSRNDEMWKSKYIRNYYTNGLENFTQC